MLSRTPTQLRLGRSLARTTRTRNEIETDFPISPQSPIYIVCPYPFWLKFGSSTTFYFLALRWCHEWRMRMVSRPLELGVPMSLPQSQEAMLNLLVVAKRQPQKDQGECWLQKLQDSWSRGY
jgi:hypothetical protein